MAIRPALAAWNTDASNRVVPSAGQKATGWTPGQKPPSGYFNWWQNLMYQWTLWLNDALVDFGASNITATDITATDDLVVGDTAAIGGATTINGFLTVAGPITAGTNSNIVMSGTGEIKHGDRRRMMNGVGLTTWPAGVAYWTVNAFSIQSMQASVTASWSPELVVGDRVKSFTALISGGGNVTLSAAEILGDGTSVAKGSNTITPIGTPITYTIDFTDFVISSTSAAVFTLSAGNADNIYNCALIYDHP